MFQRRVDPKHGIPHACLGTLRLHLPPATKVDQSGLVAVAAKSARLPRDFLAWDEIVEMNKGGYWPYAPDANPLDGLSEAFEMLCAEGRPTSRSDAVGRDDRGLTGGPCLPVTTAS